MTENTSDESEQQEKPFQFGIRSVLVLTTVCAVAAAITGSMQVPIIFQVVVVVYLMLMATYAVLRLPYVGRKVLQDIAELKRIRRQRSELEGFVADKRREIQQSKSVPDNEQLPATVLPNQPDD
jgi:hypothetical protein